MKFVICSSFFLICVVPLIFCKDPIMDKIVSISTQSTSNCTELTCLHGKCNIRNECVCDEKWDSQECPDDEMCCHKKTSRVVVFLESFFVGFTGAPYFEVGVLTLGITMIVLLACACVFRCTSVCLFESYPTCAVFLKILAGAIACGLFVWHLFLWISVAAERENFGNIAPW